MARELVSRPVVEALASCFGGELLAQIDALFGDLGIGLDNEAELRAAQAGRGQRRSRAAGYLATLDLGDPHDVEQLFQVITTSLPDWEQREHEVGQGAWDELKRLRRNLVRSGLRWDGSTLTRTIGPIPTPMLDRLGGIEDVDKEVTRILAAVDADPADAITAARALVEAACKSVLEAMGLDIDDREDLPALYKRTAVALKIDAAQHDLVYRQILQGLMSSVQGLAELRNKMGDAHSPSPRAVRAQPRHARMAAGAAMTVATFLVETLEERARQESTLLRTDP
jgi:hypothetical protein